MPGDSPIAQQLDAVRKSGVKRTTALGPPPAPGPQTNTSGQPPSAMESIIQMAKDLGIGVGKGVVEGANTVGNMIDPDPTHQQFGKMAPANINTEAANTTQQIGKRAEQVGEFFLPTANRAKLKAVEKLVRLIPNSADPATMRTLNKLAAFLGRTGGEAAHAGVVSALHGDESPETAAEVAGGVTAATQGLAPLTSAIATSPIGRRAIPVIGAGGLMSLLNNPFGAGMGAVMGTYGLLKDPLRKVMSHPMARRRIEQGVRTLGMGAARGGAAMTEGPRPPSRRRLAEGSSSR